MQGMSVVEIERDSALFRQLKGGGLVVAGVERDSRAFRAGFRPGDIIYGVNRRRRADARGIPEIRERREGRLLGVAAAGRFRRHHHRPLNSVKSGPLPRPV